MLWFVIGESYKVKLRCMMVWKLSNLKQEQVQDLGSRNQISQKESE